MQRVCQLTLTDFVTGISFPGLYPLATHYRSTREQTITTRQVSSAHSRKDVVSLFLFPVKKWRYEVGEIRTHDIQIYIIMYNYPLSYIVTLLRGLVGSSM